MRKPVFGFPTSSDTNQAVQPQKIVRHLKFQIEKVGGLYYPCSSSASLFSHMLKAGFLTTRFILGSAKKDIESFYLKVSILQP